MPAALPAMMSRSSSHTYTQACATVCIDQCVCTQKDFDVFKNILLELNGGKSPDYADSNFPTLVRKANKVWAARNGKGSAVEGRVTNVNIRAFDEDSADLLEEILENTQGKLYRPEIEGTQVERYARALEERLESLRTLNLINIELLGILQSKSSELTLLGQLLSLNQGVKTKLVDRLNYFANINRNVGSKLPGFDFMRFLTDDKYKAYTIEKYESAKKKAFNSCFILIFFQFHILPHKLHHKVSLTLVQLDLKNPQIFVTLYQKE